MKCQSLFSRKIKKNISKCHLLKFSPSMQSVYHFCNEKVFKYLSQCKIKPTIRPVWSAKTQISLYVHPVWQGFLFIPLEVVEGTCYQQESNFLTSLNNIPTFHHQSFHLYFFFFIYHKYFHQYFYKFIMPSLTNLSKGEVPIRGLVKGYLVVILG